MAWSTLIILTKSWTTLHHARTTLIIWAETLSTLATVHHALTWTELARTHARIILKTHVAWTTTVVAVMYVMSHTRSDNSNEEPQETC